MNNTKSKLQKSESKKSTKNIIFTLAIIIIYILITVLYFFLRSGSVSGKVFSTGDDRSTLSNVKITIDNKNYYNNPDSSFVLTGLSSGNHIITFEKEGYKNKQENFELENGQNLELDTYLSPVSKEVEFNNFDFIALSTNSKNIISSLPDIKYNQDYSKKYILFDNKSKIYTLGEYSNYISVLDFTTGKEINRIPFPIELRPYSISMSNLKDKIYMILSDNSIGILELNNNYFTQSTKLSSKINKLFINKNDNSGFILQNNKISLFNTSNYLIRDVLNIENLSPTEIAFDKNKIFVVNPSQQEIIKLDSNSILNEPKRIKLDYIPDKIAVTRYGKIYISSGTKLSVIDSEKNNLIQSGIDTGINISNIKISPIDNNLYITDNSANVYIFDTNKDQLLNKKISLSEPVQDIFFPE